MNIKTEEEPSIITSKEMGEAKDQDQQKYGN